MRSTGCRVGVLLPAPKLPRETFAPWPPSETLGLFQLADSCSCRSSSGSPGRPRAAATLEAWFRPSFAGTPATPPGEVQRSPVGGGSVPRGSEGSKPERPPRVVSRRSHSGASVLPGDVSCWVYSLALRRDWDEVIQGWVLKNEKDPLRGENGYDHGPRPAGSSHIREPAGHELNRCPAHPASGARARACRPCPSWRSLAARPWPSRSQQREDRRGLQLKPDDSGHSRAGGTVLRGRHQVDSASDGRGRPCLSPSTPSGQDALDGCAHDGSRLGRLPTLGEKAVIVRVGVTDVRPHGKRDGILL